jgi:hypothetical protein
VAGVGVGNHGERFGRWRKLGRGQGLRCDADVDKARAACVSSSAGARDVQLGECGGKGGRDWQWLSSRSTAEGKVLVGEDFLEQGSRRGPIGGLARAGCGSLTQRRQEREE